MKTRKNTNKLIMLFSAFILSFSCGLLADEPLIDIPPQAVRIQNRTLVDKAWNPSLSCDEQKLVFAKLDESSEQQNDLYKPRSQIWIMKSDGSQQKQLTLGEGFKRNPIFSTKDNSILFIKNDGELWLMNADGTYLKHLKIDIKYNGLPSWTSDERILAFDINKGIALYDIEKEKFYNIINLPEKSAWIKPANSIFSLDSKYIYFTLDQKLFYMKISDKIIKEVCSAEHYSLSPDGQYIACLGREKDGNCFIDVVTAKTLEKKRIYQQSKDGETFLYGKKLFWSPDNGKIICGKWMFDISRKTKMEFPYLEQPSMPDVTHTAFWFSEGRTIVIEKEDIPAQELSQVKQYNYRSIMIYFLDWNSIFASKEKVIAHLPQVIAAIAETISPLHVEKLLNQTNGVKASTRVVCSKIEDNIYDRLLELAYKKYPKELQNVIENTSGSYFYDHSNPLDVEANWGFLRRLKPIDPPLNGEFIRTTPSDDYSYGSGILTAKEFIYGYPITIKECTLYGGEKANIMEYVSPNQKIRYSFRVRGPNNIREDVTQLMLKELGPFFALEFLFDANDIYNISLDESLKKVQNECKKFAESKIAKRHAAAAKLNLSENGWPKYNRDLSNSGYVKDTLTLPLKLAWKQSFKLSSYHSGWASPLVDENYLYVSRMAPDDGYGIHILDRKTGEILANISIKEGINTTPVISNNYIYVLRGEKILSAYEKGTWKEIWMTHLPGQGKSQETMVTLSDGIIVSLNQGGYISALNATDGMEIWKEGVYNAITKPIIAGGKIIYADYRSLIARDLENGRIIWKFEFDDYSGSPWSDSGSIFYYLSSLCYNSDKVFAFSCKNISKNDRCGYFSAFDVNSGKILWQYKIDQPFATAAACDSETVVFAGKNQNLEPGENFYALDIKTGQKRWMLPIKLGWHVTSPIIVGRHVIMIWENGIYIVDLNTGEIIQDLNEDTSKTNSHKFEIIMSNKQFLSPPSYYDGFLYLLDSKGNIFAYH